MKIKDIKDKLKQEEGQTKVPDVLERAKRAPINKLLTGETPLQAFSRTLAMRLLVFATLLLVVAIFSLMAMWLAPTHPAEQPYCYVSVTVLQGEEELHFGMIAKSDGNVYLCCKEKRWSFAEKPAPMAFSSISELYQLKIDDKVYVRTISDDRALAKELEETTTSELRSSYYALPDFSPSGFVLNSAFASSVCRDELKEYLAALGKKVSADPSSQELIEAYLSLLGA